MKWVFGILCLFFAAFGFGLRLHPERLIPFFNGESFEHYYEIEFFSGQKMAGKLVSESANALEMTLGAGAVFFQKKEIKSRRLLNSDAVRAGNYSDILLHKAGSDKALVSVRYEDSFFYTAEKRFESLFLRAAAKLRQESAAVNPVNSLRLEHAAEPGAEAALPLSLGSTSPSMPSSAVRGFASQDNQQQDYAALIKAGLDQLRNSAK